MSKFVYKCVKCNGPARKEPCEKGRGSLGTWYCPVCGRNVTVKRENV